MQEGLGYIKTSEVPLPSVIFLTPFQISSALLYAFPYSLPLPSDTPSRHKSYEERQEHDPLRRQSAINAVERRCR